MWPGFSFFWAWRRWPGEGNALWLIENTADRTARSEEGRRRTTLAAATFLNQITNGRLRRRAQGSKMIQDNV